MPRIEQVRRDQPLRIFFGDQEFEAYAGETVAAALLANGQTTLRRTAKRGEPRGLFCGMGVCFDCLMCIDGRPNQQACLTLVREGMRVDVQEREEDW